MPFVELMVAHASILTILAISFERSVKFKIVETKARTLPIFTILKSGKQWKCPDLALTLLLEKFIKNFN